tara:strand:- start:80 stop:271 length:192 start_codon:yes stop_codon:yes gene_type:complete
MIKYIIVTLMALGVGCASTNTNTIDEIIPSDDKLYDLLHIADTYAYKSVTIEDYKDNDDVCEL